MKKTLKPYDLFLNIKNQIFDDFSRLYLLENPENKSKKFHTISNNIKNYQSYFLGIAFSKEDYEMKGSSILHLKGTDDYYCFNITLFSKVDEKSKETVDNLILFSFSNVINDNQKSSHRIFYVSPFLSLEQSIEAFNLLQSKNSDTTHLIIQNMINSFKMEFFLDYTDSVKLKQQIKDNLKYF